MRSRGFTGSRRFWGIVAASTMIVAIGLILVAPRLLSLTVAHRILAARAGRILAPGSLEAKAVVLSWSGPTEIEGVVLRDERGTPLVTADRVLFGWNFLQILFGTSEPASLKLPGATVQVERRADGGIDLYETLRPIISEHPEHRLVIAIPDGRLRLRDEAMAGPILDDRASIRLDIPRDPQPIEWHVELERPVRAGLEPGRATFEGSAQHAGGGSASIAIRASRWPLAVETAGGQAVGALDGRLSAERRDDGWMISGDATAGDLAVPGVDPKRATGLIRAAWEVESRQGTWTARRLELAIPYARIDGGGTVEEANGIARVDLKGSMTPDWAAIQSDLRRDVEPEARIAGRPGSWRLTGSLGGEGDKGRLANLGGELGLRLDTLDVYGLRLSETAVVLRADGGRFRFDPIDARLNEGAVHLEPEVIRPESGPVRIKLGAASTIRDAVVNDEVSHRVLSYVAPVLDGATRVRGKVSVRGLDAEIPIGEAAGASARVAGDVLFDDVRFLPGPLAETIIDLIPRDREAGDADEPMLVLRDPISFRIADRKVYQQGLTIPVGRVGTVGLEGSVDFEKRLDLLARFRVNPPRADRPMLAALLNNARFELPIRGTLQEPRIDEQELKERLKSLGADLLDNSIVAGAGSLLRLLDGLPRRREARKPPGYGPDPGPARETPARPTPEERRQLREERRQERMEKKAERRARREGAPD